MKFICFDLEGPLSPQDNAYELMKLFPQGDRVFTVISRYDDLLALEGREGYEPGDTLALIVPFLTYHGISEDKIIRLAERAGMTPGAPELIAQLHSQDWEVFCISTSYEQYAVHIARRLSIPIKNVACTSFPLDRLRQTLCQQDFAPVARVEEEILGLCPVSDDRRIKERLDRFFWQELPGTALGQTMQKVNPVGGQRKVDALSKFSTKHSQPLSQWVAIGDSITDFKMLAAVDQAGGLAIAFNVNEYALPYSTIGLASTNIFDLWPLLQAWDEGQRQAAEALVKGKELTGGVGDREHFHWMVGRRDLDQPLAIHKRVRMLVREEAARLG